jgi:hypothetical protein
MTRLFFLCLIEMPNSVGSWMPCTNYVAQTAEVRNAYKHFGKEIAWKASSCNTEGPEMAQYDGLVKLIQRLEMGWDWLSIVFLVLQPQSYIKCLSLIGGQLYV